ncbi:unnamed protein product [Arabidopsis lyrata]|nr:unnamed protein product [Arabidopsis lyrata]
MLFSTYAPSPVVLKGRLGKFVEEIAIYVGFFLASSPDLLSQSQSSASEVTFNKKTSTSDEPKPKRLRKAKDTKTSSSILNMP